MPGPKSGTRQKSLDPGVPDYAYDEDESSSDTIPADAAVNLFRKALCFTDLHLGLKSNSDRHNRDCLEFVEFAVREGKRNDCETCIFLGDWHHGRSSLHVSTLNYSVRAMEILNDAFEQVIFLPGNHDEFYRDSRDMNSLAWIGKFDSIRFFDEITETENVCIVPWLIGDEALKIPTIEAKYVFGHFELPGFFMNSAIRMPDRGGLGADDIGCSPDGAVYSGHFHMRQTSGRVTYIGNAFPHNYADEGQENERGIMMLEWEGTPEYRVWPDSPRYLRKPLSAILERPDDLLRPGTYCRAETDVNLSYEEIPALRDSLISEYGLREFAFVPVRQEKKNDDDPGTAPETAGIDDIVKGHLANLRDGEYDAETMIGIYEDLDH